MNRALIRKVIRDHRLMFCLSFLGAVIVPVLVIMAFSSAPPDLVTQWMNLPFVRDIFRAMLGTDLTDMLSRTNFAAFAFVHPIMLALVWAFLIVICTTVPAAEVDRGTADLLLSLPISRLGVYLSVSVVVVCCGAILGVCPWLGAWISERLDDWPEPLNLGRLGLAVVNNLAAIWAVAGVGMAVSAASSRRGMAVGVLFGWLLASFLLNFLGALWEPAQRLEFLSLLNYFRPLIIVRDGALDAGHIAVLLAIGLVGWIIGGIVFTRRDIRTT